MSQWWDVVWQTRPMATTRRLRAAAMTRLSSYTGEEDTSTSPERQSEVCDAYAVSKDWEIVARIQDLDVSASDKGLRLDRPGLIKARALYPTIDVLLVPKLDRLARNVKDFMSIVEEAQAAGVAVVLIAEGLDLTTASGRFVAQILAAFAELEAATISQRTKEAVAYLARVGRHRGGPPAYGHAIVQRDGQKGYYRARDPERAPYLEHLIERVTGGEKIEPLCEEFRALGYPSPGADNKRRDGRPKQGPAWDPDYVRNLLRSPALRGFQIHQGELIRGDDGIPIRPHDALVTDTEWYALQAAVAPGAPLVRATDIPNAMLRGVVACAMCGMPMHSIDRAYPVWSCSRKVLTPDGTKCPGTTVQRLNLEEHVVSEVLRLAGHLPGYAVVEEERADVAVAEISEALDATLSALRDVVDEDAEGVLLTRRRALRARLTELQDAPVLVESSVSPTGTTFAEDYAAASHAGRATLIRSQVALIAIRKGAKGKHGLDVSRVRILYRPAATAYDSDVRPGVVYRDAV